MYQRPPGSLSPLGLPPIIIWLILAVVVVAIIPILLGPLNLNSAIQTVRAAGYTVFASAPGALSGSTTVFICSESYTETLELAGQIDKCTFTADGTNDHVEINLGIDSLSDSKGKVVLSRGTFTFGDSITLNSPSERVKLVGMGMRETIIEFPSGDPFDLQSGTLTLEDIGFTNLRYAILVGSPAVSPAGDFSLYVRRCRFANIDRAVQRDNLTNTTDTLQNLVFTDSEIDTVERGLEIAWRQIANAFVSENLIENVHDIAVRLGNNNFSTDPVPVRRHYHITNNSIKNVISENTTPTFGILAYGDHMLISGNTVERVGSEQGTEAHGIYIKARFSIITSNTLMDAGGNTGAIIVVGPSRDDSDPSTPWAYANNISDNIIRFSEVVTSGMSLTGIEVRRGLEGDPRGEVIINGNWIEGATDGIVVAGRRIVISNNIIFDTGALTSNLKSAAIELRMNSDNDEGNILVTGNIIDGIGGAGDSTVGIYLWADENSTVKHTTIAQNIIRKLTGSGTTHVGIRLHADGILEDVYVLDNQIDNTPTTGTVTTEGDGTITRLVRRNNLNHTTENSGTATIANSTTSIAITHGLDVTPSAGNCMVTAAEDPTNSPGALWIDTYTSTQFTVNVENDPGASNLDVVWSCQVF